MLHHLGVSAFATHAVVDRRSVVKVDDDVPADVAALLAGFGAQHRKMAKELYLSNPLFASCLDEVDELSRDR